MAMMNLVFMIFRDTSILNEMQAANFRYSQSILLNKDMISNYIFFPLFNFIETQIEYLSICPLWFLFIS